MIVSKNIDTIFVISTVPFVYIYGSQSVNNALAKSIKTYLY